MYFVKQFIYLETVEQRLEVLFKLKEKWTLCELEVLLGEFLEPDVKMLVMLGKQTRQLKEPSPLDKARLITYYIKKF